MVGDMVSWVAGLSLLFFGGLVLYAYRPDQWPRGEAPGVLQAAIFLGFLSAVGNTVYWQVFAQPAVRLDLISVETLRFYGDYLDLLFKGGGALAGYLHLKAIHMSLSKSERSAWGVLEVAFYPKRRLCLRMLSRLMRPRNRD